MAASNRPRTEKPKGPGFLGTVYDKVFHNYVWQSIFRSGYPNTPRNQMVVVATNVFLHLHPTRIHKTHVKITHTYCLGGLSFFLFLGLTVTGVLLMFYYVPSVERAYSDIAALFIGFHPDDVFGRLISVDAAELVIVFGTIAISMAFMVVFGNWWSR